MLLSASPLHLPGSNVISKHHTGCTGCQVLASARGWVGPTCPCPAPHIHSHAHVWVHGPLPLRHRAALAPPGADDGARGLATAAAEPPSLGRTTRSLRDRQNQRRPSNLKTTPPHQGSALGSAVHLLGANNTTQRGHNSRGPCRSPGPCAQAQPPPTGGDSVELAAVDGLVLLEAAAAPVARGIRGEGVEAAGIAGATAQAGHRPRLDAAAAGPTHTG